MGTIRESYRKVGDGEARLFDVGFWQSQGAEPIFHAALEMIQDYQRIRYGHAEEARIDKTVEHYGRVEFE